ncbi:hypothetical protein HDU76_006998 [Blyttiomyces sp. JEL0837]|nr:hypothetical protein HDU76_006998 [Blyttiomyces sp. JEL0837]
MISEQHIAIEEITITSPTSATPGSIVKATIRTRGATISHLIVKDQHGIDRDIVQGADTLEEMINIEKNSNPYYGTIGRVCNRTANGTFTLNSKTYTLPINNGPNHLHGGITGFDKKQWTPTIITPSSTTLTYQSPHNEEGYPGTLNISVTFSITNASSLEISYKAELDASSEVDETVVNLTNHSYFNLSGFLEPTVLNHDLIVYSDLGHLALNQDQIPTGKVIPWGSKYVDEDGDDMSKKESTALDFTTEKPLGRDISLVDRFRGYDHFIMIREPSLSPPLKLAATLSASSSGLKMDLYTTVIGFQLYTGNWLDGSVGYKKSQGGNGEGKGTGYGQFSGVCLECSGVPDAVNSKDEGLRGEVLVRKGHDWKQVTRLEFGVC